VITNGKSRLELEQQATIVRSRLLRAVEELERRGHDALDLQLQLRMHLRRVVFAGLGLMVVLTGSVALAVQRATAAAAERRRLAHRGLWRGGWRSPPPPPRRSFFGEVGRSFGIAAVTALSMVPVRRLAAQLVAPPAAVVHVTPRRSG